MRLRKTLLLKALTIHKTSEKYEGLIKLEETLKMLPVFNAYTI